MLDSSLTAGTMVEVLERHAATKREAPAYVFLVDGEDDKVSITYAELDRRARSIAAHLQSRSTTGDRALLLYPQGIEYLAALWGCLYAGVVAIPAYPPSLKKRSASRIEAIAGDSQCRLVLTTRQIIATKKPVLEGVAELRGADFIATDAVGIDLSTDWRRPAISVETLAYLQYTSGSTSSPKGVMISHRNLLHNLAYMHRMLRLSSESRFVSWGPFFHDMGLIMGTMLPLFGAFPCVLMSPASFAQRPLRWLQAISRFRATASFGSNFAFDRCVESIAPEQRAGLDLSCWQVAVNGSEPVRAETLARFADAYRPHGFRRDAFYPGYGLAEATLAVSCGHSSEQPAVKTLRVDKASLEKARVVEASPGAERIQAQVLVGCGLVDPEVKVVIVDPETKRQLAPGRVGEIWVSADSVAQGYWRRPEETEATFRAHLSDSGEGPFLRTGDLGFVRNGELYITGRLKDLVIIRGRNIYPQDIELTVERSHPALRPGYGAAFSIDFDGEERLVIVHEIDRGGESEAHVIVPAVRRAVVEEHEVQPYSIILVRPGTILKTSSGKIQRRACREAYLKGELREYA